MVDQKNKQNKSIQERIAEEELIREKVDTKGDKWRKVYFGGGKHFINWLDQCRELGEVMVEEVDFTGYKCFEEGGEKLYRIWVKMSTDKDNDIFDQG